MQNLKLQLAKEVAKECKTVEDVHNMLKDNRIINKAAYTVLGININ